MTHNQAKDAPCCPVFDPETWDRKTWECAKKFGHNHAVAFAKVG